ncbi:MAG: ribosomal protein S18 acetylase RimI-like enzyme [Cellvibrionaceae bacterium]|jgi:ribosomal protein S18 acetylase RimI-like enzyme
MNSPVEIEQLALNAWPGLNTYLHAGLVVRWADGYTKRANSATALFDASWTAEKQQWVEAFYAKRNQRPIFRLLSFTQPEAFDQKLAAAGYEQLDLTAVMSMNLQTASFQNKIDSQCKIIPLDSWLEIFHALDQSKLGEEKKKLHHALLSQIPGQVCPMVLFVADEPAACGLGVLDGGTIGLFDIITSESHRRRGYGNLLLTSLLAWGCENGADESYLQVVEKNLPAISLYEKLGFTQLYRYWYRAA